MQNRRHSVRLVREIKRRKAGEATIRKGKVQARALALESRVMHEKLRQLTRKLLSMQEDERRVISRELHDGIIQRLVGINLVLTAASARGPLLKPDIVRVRRMVTNSVRAVHAFAHELRPAVLDDFGLVPALQAYAARLAEREKLKMRLVAIGAVEALDTAKRTAMYRVAQEALTNVARHARARHIVVNVARIPGWVSLEVRDDGKSFDVETTFLAKNPKRLGLIGMVERLAIVGGRLSVESAPGKGTTVRAEVPV